MGARGTIGGNEKLSGSVSAKSKLGGSVSGNNSLKGGTKSQNIFYTDAYNIALANGFEGTIEEWLASHKGEKGDPGSDATVTKANIEAALGYVPANGDSIWEAIHAHDEQIAYVSNGMTGYCSNGSFVVNEDGSCELSGGHEFDAMMEAFGNQYRVELCLENDGRLYNFTLSEIDGNAGCIVFTSPEYEVRHYQDGRWQMTKRDIVADVIAALPIYDGEVVDV